jgi:hypothetical protein
MNKSYPLFKCKVAEMYAKLSWCEQYLGPSGERWYRDRGYLCFWEEKDYMWFKLRWLGDSKILEWRELS